MLISFTSAFTVGFYKFVRFMVFISLGNSPVVSGQLSFSACFQFFVCPGRHLDLRGPGNTVLQFYWDGEIQCTSITSYLLFYPKIYFRYHTVLFKIALNCLFIDQGVEGML